MTYITEPALYGVEKGGVVTASAIGNREMTERVKEGMIGGGWMDGGLRRESKSRGNSRCCLVWWWTVGSGHAESAKAAGGEDQ